MCVLFLCNHVECMPVSMCVLVLCNNVECYLYVFLPCVTNTNEHYFGILLFLLFCKKLFICLNI